MPLKEMFSSLHVVRNHIGLLQMDILKSICCNQIKKKQALLLLHVKNVRKDYSSIVINSLDTNAFVLTQAVADKAYQSIDLENCGKSVLLDTLVAFHCFSGCDSMSAFTGRGKIKAFVLMCKRLDPIKAFSILGKYEKLPDECLKEIEILFILCMEEVQKMKGMSMNYKIYYQ